VSTTHSEIPGAHDQLSALIKKETGAVVHPHLLRLFLRARWPEVSRLAHAIHEAPNPGEEK
jgi:hypothetical protein